MSASSQPVSNEEDIARKIDSFTFERRLFGIDELDALNKMKDMQQDYHTLLMLQEARYQALLDEKDKTIRSIRHEEA